MLCGSQSPFLLGLDNISLYVCSHILFIHQWILGCFHILAAMNMGMLIWFLNRALPPSKFSQETKKCPDTGKNPEELQISMTKWSQLINPRQTHMVVSFCLHILNISWTKHVKQNLRLDVIYSDQHKAYAVGKHPSSLPYPVLHSMLWKTSAYVIPTCHLLPWSLFLTCDHIYFLLLK
jgi:hypothetical protein